MSKIDLKQLATEIQHLKRWHPLYAVLRDELCKLGYWKNLPRGNPKKAYEKGWGKHGIYSKRNR
jgi:hypothetical protein